ncbi:MAG: glutamine-hydrolyzing carbamoyl-phosphate synthase small subunit [Clostridia bacterium]|nr:glutamine-hydrolyzing carbamoyl-phosphate synthase small subunit [Clostridia bacterium]
MEQNKKIKLVLEDGSEYIGSSFGADTEKCVEIVFNTSMVGYQEIISDPSYTYQAVVMTYPLIGNYGICDDDYETDRPSVSALICKEYCDEPSNFRCAETLSEVMKRYDITGLSGIDTRKLGRHIRDNGSCKAILCDAGTTVPEALNKIAEAEYKTDAVATVSTPKSYTAGSGRRRIVAIDCGMKKNIVREFIKRDCTVTVVPWNASPEKIMSCDPDGLFISNGPGDPESCTETVATVKTLLGRLPVFGICLGHQIIALASGAHTYKLKFGHRGGNHPVKNLETGKIEITSQNHSYAVDPESLEGTGLIVSHMNLLDNTVEGLENAEKRVFSVQYHPESAPGPQDSSYLFDKFLKLTDGFRKEKNQCLRERI